MLNDHPGKFKRALKDYMRSKRAEFIEAELQKNREECEQLKATVANMREYWDEVKNLCESIE